MENGKARAVTSGSGQEAIEIKHLGDICKINGAEIEPFPIAVTKKHFPEEE